MRQEFFRIPLEGPWSLGPLGDVPGLGFGIVLFAWVALAAWTLFRHRRNLKFNGELAGSATIWFVVALVIVLVPGFIRRHHEKTIETANAVLTSAPSESPDAYKAYELRDHGWRALRTYEIAIETYRQETEKKPNSVRAHRKLAWLLATATDDQFRDGKQALEHATLAARLTKFQDAANLEVLAAAAAETGDFKNAVVWASQAAEEATTARANQPSIAVLRKQLASYLAEKPYRDRGPQTSIPIYGYGFMFVLGFLFAGWAGTRRAQSVGLPDETVSDLAMCVLISGILGARLFYLVQYHDQVFFERVTPGGALEMKKGMDLISAAVNLSDGGLVLFGGVLMAIAACFWFCRRRKLNILFVADFVVPSFFIGLAFGRMGCFMNGCCYGDRCELPWAVTFPLGSVPDMVLVTRGFLAASETVTLELHPTQVYSALNALVFVVLTSVYFKYRDRDGSVLALALLTYPVTRFVLELLRGDELGKFNTALTISQWVSMGLFASGLLLTWWISRQPARSTDRSFVAIKPFTSTT